MILNPFLFSFVFFSILFLSHFLKTKYCLKYFNGIGNLIQPLKLKNYGYKILTFEFN